MTEDVSRRKALSWLGAALGLALAALTADEAKAGMAETDRNHLKGTRRYQPSAAQPAAAPPASADPKWHENPNGTSGSEHQMGGQYRFY